MLSNPESATLTQLLLSGHRLDGRAMSEYREISFRFPQSTRNQLDSSGICIAKIGATAVLARVSIEVIEPKRFRPSQGMLFVNFDASTANRQTSMYKKSLRDEEGRRLSTVLQTLLRDSIDLDALCIVAWERVFAVRVECRVLSADGNLADCGALAALVALTSFRRPDVYVQDDGKVVVDFEAQHRPRVSLGIRRLPVLVSVGLTDDSKLIVQDPTCREEAILTGGRVMIGISEHGEVCCLHTTGLTSPIRTGCLNKCIKLARSRGQSLVALVRRLLDGLAKQRDLQLAQAHARSSELEKHHADQINASFTLSSINFLPSLADAADHRPSRKSDEALEEGELLLTEDFLHDDDMEISEESEEDEEGTAMSRTNPQKQDSNSLYGLIEVVSTNKPSIDDVDQQPDFELEDSSGLLLSGGTNYSSQTATTTMQSTLRGKKKVKKVNTKKSAKTNNADYDEDVTTVVQL